MNHHQANELRECPFCRNELVKQGANFHHTDNECWLSRAKVRPCEQAAWNRRAPAPTSEPGARDLTVDQQKIKDAAYSLVLNKKDLFKQGWPLFVKIADESLATPASPAVPAETKIVPVVSTRQMDEAGCRLLPRGCNITDAERCYSAMLAAAPAVPSPAPVAPSVISNELGVMLWLYRRLPRGYGRPLFVERCIRALARRTGADIEEHLAERTTDADAPLIQVSPLVEEAQQPAQVAPDIDAMRRLTCRLASLKSGTPEAVALLVEEAQLIVAGKVEK